MTDILKNILNIAARIHDMQADGTLAMVFFSIVLVFGAINCILGYRLLRFWMMIFGFLMGAGAGLFGVYEAGISSKAAYGAAMLIAGVILAVISFAIFKAGIFIIGAGIGLTVTIYVIHPTTSFTFFLCLLTGVGLGILALRYEREVIIVGTSILGGILSGFATAKLTNMDEIPFGIIFSIGFALVGMLIQFAINRSKYEEEEAEEEEEEERPFKRKPAVQDEFSASDFPEEQDEERFDLDEDDLPEDDPDTMEELLDEYSVDEDDVIEEYLEDYYGENKKKKKRNSASPYQRQKRK